ncbi:hypothetical protein AMJ57_03640, partial [Parcubacteria bacterium SG8_24]
SASTAGYGSRYSELVRLVEETELNTLVVDVKNHRGELAFRPKAPALQPYSEERPQLGDLEEFTRPLREKGIYLIARIFVFQDPAYAERHPEWALQRQWGGVWTDYRGVKWLDPASQEVWKYNVAVAREAFRGGFDEIQFDYIRFPSDGNMSSISYPVYDGQVAKRQVIKDFFRFLDNQLRVRYGIPISADLFGLTMWNHESDLNIGQMLADALPHFDFISPMVYPSHYPAGFNGLENPAAFPYAVIKDNLERGALVYEALRAAEEARDGEGESYLPQRLGTIRPWLQDFDLGAVYTASMVRDQMRASLEGGASGWLLWNARNVYTEGALNKTGTETALH